MLTPAHGRADPTCAPLRPGPEGAFLIVYDGTFTTGTLWVTAELADGSTTRDTLELDR